MKCDESVEKCKVFSKRVCEKKLTSSSLVYSRITKTIRRAVTAGTDTIYGRRETSAPFSYLISCHPLVDQKKFWDLLYNESRPEVRKSAADVEVNSSDGRVVRASAFGAANLVLISSRAKPMILTLVFTASLLNAQHERVSLENKPASLLVAPLKKASSGIPPS